MMIYHDLPFLNMVISHGDFPLRFFFDTGKSTRSRFQVTRYSESGAPTCACRASMLKIQDFYVWNLCFFTWDGGHHGFFMGHHGPT